MINFYVLLGVNNNESSQEIKKAYRKLALKYHPDRHQGNAHEAEEMMKLLNEAKDVLLNSEKRKEYDAEFYSFQQFQSRQQQEAERKQAQQAEQEKNEQEKRQQQTQWKHERKEEDQDRTKAEHLAHETEENHKQEALASVLKKRHRLLLIFILLVLGIIFYMYQKHQNANEYLDIPYSAYGFDENTEVPISGDLYDKSVENEEVQDTNNISASLSEEKAVATEEPVLTNDQHDIQVNGNQTDSSQPQQPPKTTMQVTESEPPQHVDPIKSKALKSESAHIAPKKQDDSLSISNDDFFK